MMPGFFITVVVNDTGTAVDYIRRTSPHTTACNETSAQVYAKHKKPYIPPARHEQS